MYNYFADRHEVSATNGARICQETLLLEEVDRRSFSGIEDVTEFIFHVDDVFCIISCLIKLNTC